MKSLSGMPIAAAGMQPSTILPHRFHVARRPSRPLLGLKGLSWWKYSTHTDRMAPSWMTTRNMFQNSAGTSIFTNSSTRIMWPVEEMGSHSVMPSTRPRNADLMRSMMFMRAFLPRAEAPLVCSAPL